MAAELQLVGKIGRHMGSTEGLEMNAGGNA